MYRDSLQRAMKEKGLSQADLSRLTGISKASISQYMSGSNRPTKARQKQIAEALGFPLDFFVEDFPETDPAPELTVTQAARLMGKSKKFLEVGLQQGTCPFGYAVKMDRWCYYISPYLFSKYTGIQVGGMTNVDFY